MSLQTESVPGLKFPKATQQLHPESAHDLPEKFFGRVLVEALITGNVDDKDAKQLLEAVMGPLAELRKVAASKASSATPAKLLGDVPARTELLVPAALGRTILKVDSQAAQDANNCAVECLCDVAEATPEHEALAAVLIAIWKPLFFNQLRTQQQLGYVVSCFMRIRVTHISLVFLVQTERLPEIALKSIDKFFSNAFTHILCVVTERQSEPKLTNCQSEPMFQSLFVESPKRLGVSAGIRFREQCEGLARQLEEAPRNLWDEMSRDWLPIEERTFSFDACLRQARSASASGRMTRTKVNPGRADGATLAANVALAALATDIAMKVATLRSCTLNQLRDFVKTKARRLGCSPARILRTTA